MNLDEAGGAISYLVIKAGDRWALCTWPRVCAADSAMERSGETEIESERRERGKLKSRRRAVRRLRLVERIESKKERRMAYERG